MFFSKIHHVAIICSDYQKSKEFYTNILGLEIVSETYRHSRNSYKLDLKSGNIQLELFSFPKTPKRLTNPEATGLRHLCFEVNNIEKVVEYLKSKSIQTEDVRVDEITNKKFTFFKDPDYLPIEIYES